MQEINLLVEQKDGSIETNFEEIKVAPVSYTHLTLPTKA